MSKKFQISKLKEHRTSGSTGKPFKYYISGAEDEWRKSIYMRANVTCGQRLRDNWVVVTSPHHFGDTTKIQRIIGIYAQDYVSVFDDVKEQIQSIEKYKPDVLDGYSGSLYLIAKEAKENETHKIEPRIIFGSADFIDVQSRHLIEEVFEAPFYDQFGCGEVDRTAWQCTNKEGYHMDIDSVLMQFLDKEGNEVAPGEQGEIVYTSLFNYAQPFIRYAINDVGEPSDDECPCGITLPLMNVVEGRKDSYIVLPGGRLLSPMGFWSIMRTYPDTYKIDKFQVIQKKVNEIDILIKLIDFKNHIEIQNTLIEHIYNCLNIKNNEIYLNIDFVDDIPLDNTGKLRSVISHVEKEGYI